MITRQPGVRGSAALRSAEIELGGAVTFRRCRRMTPGFRRVQAEDASGNNHGQHNCRYRYKPIITLRNKDEEHQHNAQDGQENKQSDARRDDAYRPMDVSATFDQRHCKSEGGHGRSQPGAVAQQAGQQKFQARHFFGIVLHSEPLKMLMPNPLRTICASTTTSTITNSRRILSFDDAIRIFAPRTEPTTAPSATGPATAGTMSPRMK